MRLDEVSPSLDSKLHIWLVNLTLSDEQSEMALSWLNSYQRDKYKRRRGARAKQVYLAGRYHLFQFLSIYTGLPPSEIKLQYSRLNKPYLNGPYGQLEFNFSDTSTEQGHFGLFAFTIGRAVGVDIESINRQSTFEQIAKRRFTPVELSYVTDADGIVMQDRFLSIWTRKEAFGKALGKGINFQMNQYNLLNPDAPEYHVHHFDRQWAITQFAIDNKLISAVVHEGQPTLEMATFKLLQ